MIVPLMPNFGRDCIVVKDPKRSIFLSFIDRILGHDSRLNSFGLMDHDVDYHTFA